MAFLACVHLALFLVPSPSPGNALAVSHCWLGLGLGLALHLALFLVPSPSPGNSAVVSHCRPRTELTAGGVAGSSRTDTGTTRQSGATRLILACAGITATCPHAVRSLSLCHVTAVAMLCPRPRGRFAMAQSVRPSVRLSVPLCSV